MSFSGYLEDHWGLLVLLVGLAIGLRSDIHLARRMIFRISATNVILFIYSISCYAETYLGNQADYNVIRPILSAFNYSLIAFVLVNIIMIVYPGQRIYLYIPAVINALLCFISIPTGFVFSIDKNNHFIRGKLGYLTYFICALYLIYLIFNLFKHSRLRKEDFVFPVYMSLTSVICIIMPLFFENASLHWLNTTIAINVTLYYLFLQQQYTKRDPLTSLLNRQSYYSDAEKFAEDITAVVTMDMDGLKEINDRDGHIAGDTALKALADCFWNAAGSGQRVYRIGGDEYVILCFGDTVEKVQALIECIRRNVAETEYTCSIGYAMKKGNESIDELYQQADLKLYDEKKIFYERSGKLRRKR
ncbi:MAG: GGDEF domain-containing protein [Ruminococcus sp.]|nr:GGDEF domain-containing protein [Ruminococcus sp.]